MQADFSSENFAWLGSEALPLCSYSKSHLARLVILQNHFTETVLLLHVSYTCTTVVVVLALGFV